MYHATDTGNRQLIDALGDLDDSLEGLNVQLWLLDELAEQSPVPMVVGDAKEWIIISQAFATLLGYTRKELERQSFTAVIHPDDIPSTDDATDVAVENPQQTMRIRNRYRMRDGRYRHIEWSWRAPGKSGYSLAFATDLGVIDHD